MTLYNLLNFSAVTPNIAVAGYMLSECHFAAMPMHIDNAVFDNPFSQR